MGAPDTDFGRQLSLTVGKHSKLCRATKTAVVDACLRVATHRITTSHLRAPPTMIQGPGVDARFEKTTNEKERHVPLVCYGTCFVVIKFRESSRHRNL